LKQCNLKKKTKKVISSFRSFSLFSLSLSLPLYIYYLYSLISAWFHFYCKFTAFKYMFGQIKSPASGKLTHFFFFFQARIFIRILIANIYERNTNLLISKKRNIKKIRRLRNDLLACNFLIFFLVLYKDNI
jgi:hypothetical protein